MSETHGDEIHIESEDAAGGSKEKVVRYVLVISLLAAIVLLSAIWIFGAATQGDTEEEMTASAQMRDADTPSDTGDSLTDDADEIEAADTTFKDGLEVIENEPEQ